MEGETSYASIITSTRGPPNKKTFVDRTGTLALGYQPRQGNLFDEKFFTCSGAQ